MASKVAKGNGAKKKGAAVQTSVTGDDDLDEEFLARSWQLARTTGLVVSQQGSPLSGDYIDPRRLTFADDDYLFADCLAGKAEPMKVARRCDAERWKWVSIEELEGENFKGCALYFCQESEQAFIERWGTFWSPAHGGSGNKYDPESTAEILNPYGGGMVLTGAARCAALFMRDFLGLPRLVVRDVYGNNPPNVYVAPFNGEPDDDYLLGIDGMTNFVRKAFADFKGWLADVGRQFGCRGKAEAVLAWSGMAYAWMESESSLDETSVERLRDYVRRLEAALYDMAIFVADKAVPGRSSSKRAEFSMDLTAYPDKARLAVYKALEAYKRRHNTKRPDYRAFLKEMGECVRVPLDGGEVSLAEWAWRGVKAGQWFKAIEKIAGAVNSVRKWISRH